MNCPKCSAPLQNIHLDDKVTIENCTHCSGAFYDDAELSLKLELENRMNSALLCPKCGVKMDAGTLGNGTLAAERCDHCHGFWLDAGEIGKLRKFSGRDDVLGSSGAAPAPAFGPPPTAHAAPREPAPLAFVPHPAESSPGLIPEDSGTRDNLDYLIKPANFHQNRRYEHFQTSLPKVSYVLGEFNWKVAAGDEAQARDFIHPPYLLSEEITGKESNWSHGEYIEPEEIWRAFGMEGSPPERTGVAPAQPNPHDGSWQAMFPLFWWFFGACVFFFLLQSALAARRVVFSSEFQFNTNDPAARSFVSPPFDIKGGTANLQTEISTSLDNNWVYFNMALVDESAGTTINFGTELSHYSGIDDGEYWSEGNQSTTLYLPSVPPGRYMLRLEPEASSALFGGRIKLTHDVPQLSVLFSALALLFAPLAWVIWRSKSFEHKRWLESDHPWFETSGGDEDDE